LLKNLLKVIAGRDSAVELMGFAKEANFLKKVASSP
jgi:hypothetical protein